MSSLTPINDNNANLDDERPLEPASSDDSSSESSLYDSEFEEWFADPDNHSYRFSDRKEAADHYFAHVHDESDDPSDDSDDETFNPRHHGELVQRTRRVTGSRPRRKRPRASSPDLIDLTADSPRPCSDTKIEDDVSLPSLDDEGPLPYSDCKVEDDDNRSPVPIKEVSTLEEDLSALPRLLSDQSHVETIVETFNLEHADMYTYVAVHDTIGRCWPHCSLAELRVLHRNNELAPGMRYFGVYRAPPPLVCNEEPLQNEEEEDDDNRSPSPAPAYCSQSPVPESKEPVVEPPSSANEEGEDDAEIVTTQIEFFKKYWGDMFGCHITDATANTLMKLDKSHAEMFELLCGMTNKRPEDYYKTKNSLPKQKRKRSAKNQKQ